MAIPSSADAILYIQEITQFSEWDDAVISAAYLAEKAAQGRVCRQPVYDEETEWPEDLVEALYRRVAHNLALRSLPLGVQASISDFGASQFRVGGTDAEVRRLEAPFKRWVL